MAGAQLVFLVGMPAAGKSTVGPALARRLGRRFLDADAEIEREQGRSVAAIFAEAGEGGFRALERELVGRLCGEAAVVALGGGAIARPEVREAVARAGTVVWLRARPETLLARIGEGAASRPLLAGLAPARRLERLRELLAAREAAYATAALVVDTDERGVDEVVERIASTLAAREAAA
jgi:shikimate kinase